MASKVWLLLNSVRVSPAKVEKVVKPPQKPVIRRNRRLLEGIKLENKPMQKHPSIFTVKVATGNAKGSALTINTDARNRRILPAAPPAPTKSICFINIYEKVYILSGL